MERRARRAPRRMAKSTSRWRFILRRIDGATEGGNGRGIYNYQAEADKILRGMRHHPVLTGTGPFRIHPDDPPFVQPDHPWPSPNNHRMEEEAKASGRPWPPHVSFSARAARKRRSGRWWTKSHNMIKFVPELAGRRDGCVVSSAGVLRAVGAMGAGGGSRVLGDGGGCEPRLFQSRDGAGDGADAGPEQL